MAAIDPYFGLMLRSGASDLHLAEGEKPKLRLNGEVTTLQSGEIMDDASMRSLLREICPPQRWREFEGSGDLDFAYDFEGQARFRANYLRGQAGLGAVFRIIPSKVRSLEELGLPKVLATFAEFRSGLALVTGPTGSGKSTTLAAIIDAINGRQRKLILTLEEPIEFVHLNKLSTVVQREVGIDVAGFSDGVRAASRQDADVLLVGEMRDGETIAQALLAAEKGVLVFGTLHTNSATKSIYRMIDVFEPTRQESVRDSLAATLRAVCAQLLLRRADGLGRIACHEIFVQTRASQNLIREGKIGQLLQVMMSGRAQGMQLMDDSIAEMLERGLIDGREAYMNALNKERFSQYAPKLAG
jgi:twitching motility protein PilT